MPNFMEAGMEITSFHPIKVSNDHDQIKDQIQYIVHSLEIISYFGLLTQLYAYGYVNYLLQWCFFFLSPLHVINSIPLLLQAEIIAPGCPILYTVSPGRRPSTEAYYRILINYKISF